MNFQRTEYQKYSLKCSLEFNANVQVCIYVYVCMYIYIYMYKRGLWHVWERENMFTDFWWKNLKGTIRFGKRRHRGDDIKMGQETRMAHELDLCGSG